jgi:DNA-binding response OmpR family regulator
VLRWPAEERLRQQLAWFGLPRLLLVEPGVRPPELLDDLEDWTPTPIDPDDLLARCATLRLRAAEPSGRTPMVDDDDLLWVGSSWVALTAAQAPVLRLLVQHLDRVVPFDDLAAAYGSAGGSRHPASVRTLVTRLATRVRTVGLELVTVRGHGVVLTSRATAP